MFLVAWYRLVVRWLYKAFAAFEGGKDVLVGFLYRQRGRFAQPFVHAGMMGILAAGIMLAPVVARARPFATADPTPLPMVLSASTQVEPGTTTISDKPRDRIWQYAVESGDTFSSIAQKFGISVDTILWQNNLTEDSLLHPGQSLDILPVTGVAHTVVRGDTIYSIAQKYKANPQAILDFPFNDIQQTYSGDFLLSVGQIVIVPDGVVPEAQPIVQPLLPVAQFTPSVGVTPGSGQFIWPVSGVISQRFSWYHRAIDIANPNYPPVYAADSGTIIAAGWDNTGYGNKVMIDHGNGYITLYGHLSKIIVSVGQHVNRGQQIGIEGSTGRSTGPHVHFEIRTTGGGFINPLTMLH